MITDKLPFALSIITLSIYFILFLIANILGYGPIGQPFQGDQQCQNIYIPDLNDVSQTICLTQCPKQGDTNLQCTNCKGNIYDTDKYNNACLPTQWSQFIQLEDILDISTLSKLGLSLQKDFIYSLFALLLLITILQIIIVSIKTYQKQLLAFFQYYYPYGILWLIILIAKKISTYNDIEKLERVGGNRMLNSQSISLLFEYQNYQTSEIILIALLFKVFIGMMIAQYYYKSDQEEYRMKGYLSLIIEQNIEKSKKEKFILISLTLLNYLILYISIIASLSIGSYDAEQTIYKRCSTSIVGIIFIIIQFTLFIYASKILRIYSDYYVYIKSLRFFMDWKNTEMNKNALNAFGIVSLLAFKQIINSPKQIGIIIWKLFKQTQRAAKWENDLSLLTTLTIGRQVYILTNNQQQQQRIAEPSLQQAIDSLNIKDFEVVYKLNNYSENLLKYAAWSIGTIIGIICVIIGCGFPTIIILQPLYCDMTYQFLSWFMKGYLSIGLIEGYYTTKNMKIYDSIITIAKEEIEHEKSQQGLY